MLNAIPSRPRVGAVTLAVRSNPATANVLQASAQLQANAAKGNVVVASDAVVDVAAEAGQRAAAIVAPGKRLRAKLPLRKSLALAANRHRERTTRVKPDKQAKAAVTRELPATRSLAMPRTLKCRPVRGLVGVYRWRMLVEVAPEKRVLTERLHETARLLPTRAMNKAFAIRVVAEAAEAGNKVSLEPCADA
jgi:hypothetical protein